MLTVSTNQERWLRVQRRLQAELGIDVFNSWFPSAQLESVEGNIVYLTVPTRFLRNWLKEHYLPKILSFWQEEDPAIQRVDIDVRRNGSLPQAKPDVTPSRYAGELPSSGRIASVSASTPAKRTAFLDSALNPEYTFENFLVGRSNALAHMAAKQVAVVQTNKPVVYNPVYLYGGVGLGKTHLLQSIAWARKATRDPRTQYLTAENLTYQLRAATIPSTLALKSLVRGIDLLIVDDLHLLKGKAVWEAAQLLSFLIDGGRQVVIAADGPPTELVQFDDHTRSRLAGGLMVEVEEWEEEFRTAILKRFVMAARTLQPSFDVSEEVLAHIACTVVPNGRAFGGALKRLVAKTALSGEAVSREMVDRELRDFEGPQEKQVKIEDILRVVAKHYGISRIDLLSSRRTANVVRPRQIAMYLAKTLTRRSLPEIGRRMGDRDHTTVLHSVRKIEDLVLNDKGLAAELETLARLARR